MSCPDWHALSQRHKADPSREAEWHSALHHLDECQKCQIAAPEFEPTLFFRRLPTLEVGHDDVDAMKLAVAGMRRGQTIEHRRRPQARTWQQAAALIAVLLGSLMLQGTGSEPGLQPEASSAEAQLAPSTAPRASHEIDLWRMPLVETSDPTYGSIIQVVDDDISVVLVVPADSMAAAESTGSSALL